MSGDADAPPPGGYDLCPVAYMSFRCFRKPLPTLKIRAMPSRLTARRGLEPRLGPGADLEKVGEAMHKSRILVRSCLCSLLLIASASASSAQEPNGSDSRTPIGRCVSLRTGMGATLGAILGTLVFPGLGTGVGFILGGGGTCIYDGASNA